VQAGAAQPDIGSEAALREAVLKARSIGYSTGPSGTALMRLFERWRIMDLVEDRLVQARPGVPVGSLVASGEAALGFQQLSELMTLSGITLLGGLPLGLGLQSRFSGAVGIDSPVADEAQRLLDFMAGSDAADLKSAHGMQPVIA
jgi:molybdate transport system substrate-binding protein